MGNSTFSGPVRSENGFQVVSRNATTGAITTVADTASTGIVTNKYVKYVGFATGVTVNTTAGDSPTIGEFTQPANTIITDIKIFCDVAPIIGEGDIGYEVGTSSSGAQIVATQADNDTNAMRSMGMLPEGYAVNDFLTDPDAFFIKTDAPRGFVHFERTPLSTTM